MVVPKVLHREYVATISPLSNRSKRGLMGVRMASGSVFPENPPKNPLPRWFAGPMGALKSTVTVSCPKAANKSTGRKDIAMTLKRVIVTSSEKIYRDNLGMFPKYNQFSRFLGKQNGAVACQSAINVFQTFYRFLCIFIQYAGILSVL
jgi:hypothetical protein